MDTVAKLFLQDADARLAVLDGELARSVCPEDVGWTLCGFAGRELALADCVFYLFERYRHKLIQHAAWGPKRAAERALATRLGLELGEGVVGCCGLYQVPQLVADTRLDRRYRVDDAMRLSELAVPVCRNDVLMGVLDTEHPEADAYTSHHVRAMLAIAQRGAGRLAELMTQ